jgi:hypothetical protein
MACAQRIILAPKIQFVHILDQIVHMPDQLIPTLMPRYGFRSSKFFGGNFCGNNNFPSSHGVGHLHLLRSGQLVVEHEDGSSFVADQPVCIFYPQPYTHRLTVPEGAQAELICATLEFREAWHNPFLLALPPWMAIPVNRVMGIGEVVEMLSRESASGGLGQAFVVDKLCDILVCQLIRHAQEAGLLKAGVLAGFSDAGIAQALAAVHQDPAHNWRVESWRQSHACRAARLQNAFMTWLDSVQRAMSLDGACHWPKTCCFSSIR